MLLGPPLSLREIRRESFFVAARFIEARRPCQERAAPDSGTLRKSMIFGVVEISFDGREKRRLVVPNVAGGRLRYTKRVSHPSHCTSYASPFRLSRTVTMSPSECRCCTAGYSATKTVRMGWLASSAPGACQRGVFFGLPAIGAPASMSHGPRQPASQRDQPVPSSTRSQSGRLVSVGRGGVCPRSSRG